MTTESRKPTLLCVDDNQTALHVRKLVLESAGYSVLVASDSAAAMELFSSSAVDMVVSDHFLQDGTGIELAAAMKKLKPDVPIVIISGLVERTEGYRTRRPVHLQRLIPLRRFCGRFQNYSTVALKVAGHAIQHRRPGHRYFDVSAE